ncbi:MAG: hypothetical protein MJZ96_08785 [Paludibacteraceae bacterium]|nr:hypothetical protein [Paludibacteraceae bacterium]
MRKSFFVYFVFVGLIFMSVACKVVEPVAKDATFYQWRWNQLHVDPENYYLTYSGANFIITGESVQRDTVVTDIEHFYRESETWGTIECVTSLTQKLIHDIYIKDGHTYITGQMLTLNYDYDNADWDGSAYHGVTGSGDAYPFLEIDGVLKDITPKDPRVKYSGSCSGLHFTSDGKKLYTIIRGASETRELPQGRCEYADYYVSEDGGEPYYIGSFERFAVGDIAKVGDEWYVCGRGSTSPCFQSSTETKMYIAPLEKGGMLNGVVDYHGEPLMVGRMGGRPIVYYHDSIKNLPEKEGYSGGEAIFAKMIGDDLYVGGWLNNYPAIWKNNELHVLLTTLPKGFRYLIFTDIEVVGDMIYVVGSGYYPGNSTTHTAFFKLKDTGDLIQEYDEYDDLITSVEVMKWIGNTTWQDVEWHPDQGIFVDWRINKPRILLKY